MEIKSLTKPKETTFFNVNSLYCNELSVLEQLFNVQKTITECKVCF